MDLREKDNNVEKELIEQLSKISTEPKSIKEYYEWLQH